MKQKFVQLITASRPLSWINTAFPFVAGYLVVTHRFDWQLVLGALFFLVPYNLMMYGVNDVFDYESDMRNPRKGGIEGAVLTRESHRFILRSVAVANIPFVAVLLVLGNLKANSFLLFLLFMVLAYSAPYLRFKEKPILDSITSSIHFVGPLAYAFILTGAPAHYWAYAAAFFVWGMASHALGAVQDIKADRAGGIGSVATVMGARWTMRAVVTLYLASAVLLYNLNPNFLPLCLLGALYALSASPYLQVTDDQAEKVHDAWRRFLFLNWLTGFAVTLFLIQYLRR